MKRARCIGRRSPFTTAGRVRCFRATSHPSGLCSRCRSRGDSEARSSRAARHLAAAGGARVWRPEDQL